MKNAFNFQYQHFPSRETNEALSVPTFSTIIIKMAKDSKLSKHSKRPSAGVISTRKGNETWVKQ